MIASGPVDDENTYIVFLRSPFSCLEVWTQREFGATHQHVIVLASAVVYVRRDCDLCFACACVTKHLITFKLVGCTETRPGQPTKVAKQGATQYQQPDTLPGDVEEYVPAA